MLESPNEFLSLSRDKKNNVSFAPPQIILLLCLSRLQNKDELPEELPDPLMFKFEA